MARTFSSLIDPKKDTITFKNALTADVLPWLFGAGFSLLLYVAVIFLIKDAVTDQANPFEFAAAAASNQIYLLAGLILLGTIIARRSYRNVTTIAIGIGLVIFFAQPRNFSIAMNLFPNSILPAMVALIGVLAAGRLITFFYTRFVAKLDTVTMSASALVLYGALFISSYVLLFPL